MGVRKIAALLSIMIILQLAVPLWGDVRAEAEGGSSWHINFQPEEAVVPIGSLPDYGQLFGMRNGWNYGWNNDRTAHTVAEATYGVPELQTYVKFGQEDVWEMELDTGFYDVAVTVGDAVYESTNTVWVEGLSYFEAEQLSAGHTATVTNNILVSDGMLTLDQGATGNEQTALQHIHITKTAEWLPPDPDVITPPTIAEPVEARTAIGNKVLISGKMNNPHNAPPSLTVAGLDEEIAFYISEQVQEVETVITSYDSMAVTCSGCNETAIHQQIVNSSDGAVIRAGHLNLDNDTQFGTADQPAVVIVDGINTNQPLNIEVFGTLIIRNQLNANQGLSIVVHESVDGELGNLWVQGHLHLNNDSSVEVAGQLYVDNLTYNNGDLLVEAQRILVPDQMHINTKVNMYAQEEMAVGKLVSNNEDALLKVRDGDLFVRDNININNQLAIETGGWFAVGGNMTANNRPSIMTGTEGGQGTLLKFKLYGLLAEYFSEPDFTGDRQIQIDQQIDLNKEPDLLDSTFTDDGYAVRWTGQIQPRYTETYTFHTATKGGVRLWIDGQLLIDSSEEKMEQNEGTISLLAGQRYDIQLEYSTEGSTRAELSWTSPSQAQEIVPYLRLHPFAVPAGLRASATESAITLNWNPVANAGSYDMEVDGQVMALGNHPIFVHDSLLPGTSHQYRVRAIHDDMVGEWSPLLTSWTLPDVPQGIELSSTKDRIRLEWEPVIGATGYEVEVDSAIVDNGDALFFEMNNLNPNVQKAFRVRAKNSSGVGQWSPIVVETTIVGVPGNLTGNPSDTSIDLQWDLVSGADSYDLEIDGTILEGLVERQYVHEDVQPNTTHTYRVRAKNDNGTGGWSDYLRVFTLPSVPTDLQAATSNTEIQLTWDAVDGAVAYDIEIDGEVIDNGLQTEYHHTNLSPNTEHVYRVRARNEEVEGAWSPQLVAITLAGVPSNLQTSVTSTSITLTWNSVIGAEGYDVEVDGTVVDNGLGTTYEHLELAPLSEHQYRVRAKTDAGVGAWSEFVTARTVLAQPSISVSEVSPSTITLSWDEVPGAQSYDLLADGELIHIGAVTVYTDEDLQPSSWHYYRVRARNGDVVGDWSESVTQTTRLGTPKITEIIAESRSIWLQWDEVVGAESYELDVDGQVMDVGESVTYLHQGLSSNSTHTYRVRAKNSEGVSAWSDWSTGVTKQTTPDTPTGITWEATTDAIMVSWNSVTGASSYEVEADGVIKSGITDTSYTLSGLRPNTMHVFRVRSVGSGGSSGWSELFRESTIPELKVNVGKDTSFHFVIVAPADPDATRRQITVTYNPDELEVLDLYGLTQQSELQTGTIEGSDFTIVRFEDGRITYHVDNADNKTIFNLIQFRAKTSEYTNITYTIE